MQAALPPPKARLVDDVVIDLIRARRPRTALDYGCGRGELARDLSTSAAVTAYDPAPDAQTRWTDDRVRWCPKREDIGPVRFDVVTCNLVLCVIEEVAAYRAVLADLRNHVADDGRLILTVCHPEATFAADSAFQARRIPQGVDHDETFAWEKILPNGRGRRDVHRSRKTLERDLRSAGFEIVAAKSTGTVDLERFEPTDEFLIVEAKPITRGRRRRAYGATSIPVICYHRVLPEDRDGGVAGFHRDRGMVVDLETFEAQAERLTELFTPISLETFLAGLNGTRLPDDAVLVTFDDGYRDFLEHALPVLESLRIPSTLFAVKRCAQTQHLTPVDALYVALAHDAATDRRLSDASRRDWAFGAKKRRFVDASPGEQTRLLQELNGTVGAEKEGGKCVGAELYLTEGELADLGPMVAIGAHAVTHRLLPTLGDHDLVAELRESRDWVTGFQRGAPVLAYPSGRHDTRVLEATAAAGFDAAFTVVPYDLRGRTCSPYRLRRSCIPNRVDAFDALARGEEVKL